MQIILVNQYSLMCRFQSFPPYCDAYSELQISIFAINLLVYYWMDSIQELPDNARNGEITHYTVSYGSLESRESPKTKMTTMTTCELFLETGQTYEINLQAWTRVAPSPPTHNILTIPDTIGKMPASLWYIL